MKRYRTFRRSCRNWEQFGSARKLTQDRGLDLETARRQCANYNDNRTPAQIRAGTKMEFEEE